MAQMFQAVPDATKYNRAFAVIMSLEEVVRVGILSFIGLRLTM